MTNADDPNVRAARERLADAKVRAGICPDCGSSDWQIPVEHLTVTIRCLNCGSSFMFKKEEAPQ